MNVYLQNKELFYQFMLRKGYFMPSYKCEGLNVPFMHAVFTGECYLPKQTEVTPTVLATPPSVELTKNALIQVLEEEESPAHSNLAG